MPTSDRPHGRPVDSGRLEELGKQAARLADVSGISLTEAAVRTLGAEKLGAAQVRRVVEHCNTHAVNQKYAALNGNSRIVHIDGGPADPEQVLRGLKVSSVPVVRVEALEYAAPPSYTKQASALPAVALSPDLAGLRDKLAAAQEELASRAEGSNFAMEEALDRLKLAAAQAVRDGASLAELYAAWAACDGVMAKVAVAQLRDTLGWGTKVAGRSIDPTHAVVRRFTEFAKTASQYHQESCARRDVETQLARVETHLRRTLS